MYSIYIASTDEVSETDNDEFLELFSHNRTRQGVAALWLSEWVRERRMKQQDVAEVPGYAEVMEKLLEGLPAEKVLAMAHLTAEQRLAGLAPEQRLAGLDRDQQALALPIEVLRALSEDYLRSLSPEVQAELRRRLQTAPH